MDFYDLSLVHNERLEIYFSKSNFRGSRTSNMIVII